MAPYKVLKDLHPNKEYAELLRKVASRLETLGEPIDSTMVEQIRSLSESVIEQGSREKEEFEANKRDFFRKALEGAVKKYGEDKTAPIHKMRKRKNRKHKRIDNAALLAARGKRKRERENNNI